MAKKRTLDAHQKTRLTIAMYERKADLATLTRVAAVELLSVLLGFDVSPDTVVAISEEMGLVFQPAPRIGCNSPHGRARQLRRAMARTLLELTRIAKLTRTDADFEAADLDVLTRAAK